MGSTRGRVAAIVEARMGSSRLPGKVLLDVDGDVLLGHLIDRLMTIPELQEVVVATSVAPRDDVIQAFAEAKGVRSFRGSEDDVMERVLCAADFFAVDVIVEITADCPLLDPQIVSQILNIYLCNDCDYVSNAHIRSYPDGMDVEIFSADTLRTSFTQTSDPIHREHVSLHIRQNPELFRPVHVLAPTQLSWPELGLTLDEWDDFLLISKVMRCLQSSRLTYTCGDVLDLLRENPEWISINGAVSRKEII